MKTLLAILGDGDCEVRLYSDGSIEATGCTVDEGDELARYKKRATLDGLMKKAIELRHNMLGPQGSGLG